jgi:hypothetical protein
MWIIIDANDRGTHPRPFSQALLSGALESLVAGSICNNAPNGEKVNITL